MAYSSSRFEAEMDSIKSENQDAYDWLVSKGPQNWARCHFRTGPKCEILLNNLCESFNGTRAILMARQKPILSMLERIRMYLLQRFTKQRLAAQKWAGELGPRIHKILETNKVLSAENIAYWAGDSEFQVSNMYGSFYRVNLAERTCSCRRWDVSGNCLIVTGTLIAYFLKNSLLKCVIYQLWQVFLVRTPLVAYGSNIKNHLTTHQIGIKKTATRRHT